MTAPADLVPGVSADVAKVYRHGTHRVVAPAETVDALRPLLPVFGITRVGVVTGLDGIGIPVVMVCRPNARSLAVSQGKGADLDAARASGLMESIELYHAERIARPLKFAAWDELRFTRAGCRASPTPASTPPCACSGSRGSTSSGAPRSGSPTRWSTWTTPCRCRRRAATSS
jgi:ribosomal protein S12 methylthiotransferase accessory factor